jgi:hypothetical protein
LIKLYLATGRFDDAVEQANILIDGSGYKLMENNFGTFVNPEPEAWPITRNVIWDLHRPENMTIAANTEVILAMPNREESATSRMNTVRMRDLVPFWSNSNMAQGAVQTPDGKPGMEAVIPTAAQTWLPDYRRAFGRGIANIRPTGYATHDMWVKDKTDLRHSSEVGNWVRMEDLKYMNRNLYNSNPRSEYWGQNLRLYSDDGRLLCTDTIRCWYDWPQYKTWIEDPRSEGRTDYNGGAADLYLFRLAETYLMRAEAKFWLGDLQGAADDVNTVRRRAKCSVLFTADEMNMGVIMDERARELYMEEFRNVELTRVSLLFAMTGKTDEFGQTYSVNTLEDNSYWWQRITKYNDFYNKGVATRSGVSYTIAPHHIYWPIVKSVLEANRGEVLNQNKGYGEYENNIEPWGTLEEAVADETNVN